MEMERLKGKLIGVQWSDVETERELRTTFVKVLDDQLLWRKKFAVIPFSISCRKMTELRRGDEWPLHHVCSYMYNLM